MPEGNPTAGNKKDVEENKAIAAVGYLFILCLVPLLLKPDSPYAKFHGKQGLVLAIASVAWGIISMFLGVIPILGWLISLAGWIGLLILAIMGIMNALDGKYWEMPVLGKYTKMIKL